MNDGYDLQLTTTAARAVQKTLPEGVAAAVIEFMTGSLLVNPRRVGKPLRRELTGLYSARRGTFRIIHRIDDAENLITVVRVEHRVDAYRRR
ncbi:MAG TPA: type II toxin-antitoxin system RelE/ParE family toxin [Pseudonocardia sp.]